MTTDNPFFDSLYDARDRIAALPMLIEGLRTTRQRILSAPAHTDDIVEAVRGGIDAACTDFEHRLASASTDPELKAVSDVWGSGAAIYFMRQLVEAKIPALVARLCPDARSGMTPADRQQALRKLDGQISDLRDEMETLRRTLSQAQVDLRDQRQQAIWGKDWKTRCTIESEERVLSENIEYVRRMLSDLTERNVIYSAKN